MLQHKLTNHRIVGKIRPLSAKEIPRLAAEISSRMREMAAMGPKPVINNVM